MGNDKNGRQVGRKEGRREEEAGIKELKGITEWNYMKVQPRKEGKRGGRKKDRKVEHGKGR